eukprot:6377843-Amphidinium_carterae.2
MQIEFPCDSTEFACRHNHGILERSHLKASWALRHLTDSDNSPYFMRRHVFRALGSKKATAHIVFYKCQLLQLNLSTCGTCLWNNLPLL